MIQIKINGEFVETNENLSVTLQQGVEEPSNITSRSFKHSYTIAIENNSFNRKVFNHFDPKKTGNFNYANSDRVEIYSDGTQIFDGTAKITEVSADEIQFFCISSESSWVQEIQGNLKDVDFGTGYTFCGSREGIAGNTSYPTGAVFMTDFWSGNTSKGITTNEILQFPLISYGNFYVGEFVVGLSPTNAFDFFFSGIDGRVQPGSLVRVVFNNGVTTNALGNIFEIYPISSPNFFRLFENGNLVTAAAPLIYYNDVARMNFLEATEYYDVGLSPLESTNKYSLIHELEMEDIPPAVNIKKTFDGIFSNTGWKIQSGFLESNKFKNLYLSYSGKKDPGLNWGTLSNVILGDSNLFTDSQSFYLQSLVGNISPLFQRGYWLNFIESDKSLDNANNYDITKGYIVPKTGKYKITLEVNGTNHLVVYPIMSGLSSTVPSYALINNVIYLSKRVNSELFDDFEVIDAPNSLKNYMTATTETQEFHDENVIYWFNTNWSKKNYVNDLLTFVGNSVSPYDFVGQVIDKTFGYNSDTTENYRVMVTSGPQIYDQSFPGELNYSYAVQISLNTFLRKGEKVKLTNGIGSYYNDIIASSTSDIDVINCEFELIENEDGSPAQRQLLPQQVMPEMSKVDFVKSVVNSFNLYSITDYKNKTILFEPRDKFILPSHFSVDYSNKDFIDFKQSPFDISRNYEFSWAKDDNDIYSIPIEGNDGIQYFEYRGDGTLFKEINNAYASGNELITNKFGFSAERVYKNRLPVSQQYKFIYCPTMMRKEDEFVPQRNVNWSFDHPPKIIEWHGLQDGAFILDEELRMQFPYAASTFSSGQTLTWYDINYYSDPLQSTEKGMFFDYYKNQFEEYQKSELTEISFILSTKEYLELDTRKQIFWNECHFRVINIVYNPSTKIAKLKMIKTNI